MREKNRVAVNPGFALFRRASGHLGELSKPTGEATTEPGTRKSSRLSRMAVIVWASMTMSSPSYRECKPASLRASVAARGASRKTGTSCELLLRRALWRAGCRYRTDVASLPGRPDIVFAKARVAVFCDGDFWHGKDWEGRREKLAKGNNPGYWTKKIRANMDRDRRNTLALVEQGWIVLRFWESSIRKDLSAVTQVVLGILDELGHRKGLYGNPARPDPEVW